MIDSSLSDEAFLLELGERFTRLRLEQNLTQAALATKAGVSKRTVERLESGAVATQLSGFVRVCRALGLLERFDLLVPAPIPSPITQLKLQGKVRQRASQKRVARKPGKKWAWGSSS